MNRVGRWTYCVLGQVLPKRILSATFSAYVPDSKVMALFTIAPSNKGRYVSITKSSNPDIIKLIGYKYKNVYKQLRLISTHLAGLYCVLLDWWV